MIYGKRKSSSKDTQGTEASQAERGRGKRSCADTLPYLQRSMLNFFLTIKQLTVIKQMILIADPAKPFKFTPKQTLRRSEILRDYADEIAEAYRAFDSSTSSLDSISPPSSWEGEVCVGFIRAAVTRILGHDLEDDDDFFQNGLNR